jgi:thioredoxin-related protein
MKKSVLSREAFLGLFILFVCLTAAVAPKAADTGGKGEAADSTGDVREATGASCQEGGSVAWAEYGEAVEKARKTKRPVVIVFYKDKCRKCEMIKKKGFNRPETACYVNQKFAASRLNGKNHPELAGKYRVANYPTVWFLTPQAEEIDYFVGYVNPEKLLLILKYVGEGVYEKKSFSEYEKERKK